MRMYWLGLWLGFDEDVLAVASDHGEAAVGVVQQVLRVDLADVELLGRQHQPLAVVDLLSLELLDVERRDLIVPGEHDLERGERGVRVGARDGVRDG